ncbi:MAG: hypothetical protein KDE51_04495 [Anaerolineales bacterium]|nr:hypothetical protein [Anaerolineales bacterium]
MSLDIENIHIALTDAVTAALAASGITAAVKRYRFVPGGNSTQVQVTSFGSLPERNAAGGDGDVGLDFAIIAYAPAPSTDENLLASAETTLNQIEQSVVDAMQDWRGVAYPWLSVQVKQKSKRPVSPMDLVQWRLAAIYLTITI